MQDVLGVNGTDTPDLSVTEKGGINQIPAEKITDAIETLNMGTAESIY